MEESIAFTIAYNQAMFYSRAALFWFLGGWLALAVLGALYTAWDSRRRGALNWGWLLGILVGGSIAFPLYLLNVKGAKKTAITLWVAFLLVPSLLFIWSSKKRYVRMDKLSETHQIVPLRP